MSEDLHPEKCPSIREIASMLGLEVERGRWAGNGALGWQLIDWLESCPVCRERLATLERWQDEVGYPDPLVVVDERNRARALWQDLEEVPIERLKEVLGPPHFFWAMCTLLTEKSRDATAYAPQRAVGLAEAAASLTVFLDPDYYTPQLLADLRARTWAYLGNAQRIAGDLAAADASLDDALGFLARGTRSVATRALIADLLGSLRADQRRFLEADETLQLAATLYEQAGRMHMVGKVHLLLGNVAHRAGDTAGAVVHLTQAQQLIEEGENRFLFATCQHNLVDYLTKAGHFEEAELRVPIVRSLWQELGHYRASLRLRWIEGHIQHGLGNTEGAIAIFREVTWSFERNQSPFDVALVQLDLASLLATEGRLTELEELAQQAFESLSSRGVQRDALRAIGLLRDAAITRTVTVQLLEEVARLVSQTRGSSSLG